MPLVVGLLLVVAAALATVWNERRAGAGADLRGLVQAELVEAGHQEVEPALEGEILRVAGPVSADGHVREPALDKSFPVLRLDRIVETAQWREEEIVTQGGRDLRYHLVWSASRIDSSRFRDGGGAHPNPPLRLESERFLAPSPRLGAWSADHALWHAIRATEPVRLPDRIELSELGPFSRGSDWWWSGDPDRPAPGDIRLRYRSVPLARVTLIGRAQDGRLTTLADEQGEELALGALGDVPADELVGKAATLSATETWKLRLLTLAVFLLGGFILAFALKRLAPELLAELGGNIRTTGGLGGLLMWLGATVTVWLLVRFR